MRQKLFSRFIPPPPPCFYFASDIIGYWHRALMIYWTIIHMLDPPEDIISSEGSLIRHNYCNMPGIIPEGSKVSHLLISKCFINVLVTQTKLADSKIAFSNGREVTFQLCHNQMLINFCWTDIYHKFSRLIIINPPLKSMHVV